MLYPKIEDCIDQIGNKYALAIIAAKRGREIFVKMPAVLSTSNTKELTYALREIAEGRVVANFGTSDTTFTSTSA